MLIGTEVAEKDVIVGITLVRAVCLETCIGVATLNDNFIEILIYECS